MILHTLLIPKYVGSTEFEQPLEEKEHKQEKPQERVVSSVSVNEPYHSQSIHPTPNKKVQLSPMNARQ